VHALLVACSAGIPEPPQAVKSSILIVCGCQPTIIHHVASCCSTHDASLQVVKLIHCRLFVKCQKQGSGCLCSDNSIKPGCCSAPLSPFMPGFLAAAEAASSACAFCASAAAALAVLQSGGVAAGLQHPPQSASCHWPPGGLAAMIASLHVPAAVVCQPHSLLQHLLLPLLQALPLQLHLLRIALWLCQMHVH